MSEFLKSVLGNDVTAVEASLPQADLVAVETPVETPAEVPEVVESPAEAPKVEESTPAPPIPNKYATEWRKEAKQVKRENQALRSQLAELNAKVDSLTKPKIPTEPITFNEPDPAEVYIQQNALDPETPLPFKVMKERDAWQARRTQAERAEVERQTAIKAEETAKVQNQRHSEQEFKQVYDTLAETDLSEDVLGDGLGMEDVVEAGSEYLTDADKKAIRVIGDKHGPDKMWRTYYQHSLKRLIESGSPEGVEFKARVRAVLEAKKAPLEKTASEKAVPAPKPTNEAPPELVFDEKSYPTLSRLGISTEHWG